MTESEELALLDCETEFDRRVLSNLDLASYIAHRYRWTGAEVDDLIQLARLGLINAAKGFKADKGVKFSSYASTAMINTILRGVFGTTYTPKNDIKPNYIYSLEWVNSEGFELKEMIPDEKDVLEPVLNSVAVDNLLSALPEKQKDIVIRRCMKEETLNDVAKVYGVSREYIRKIEKKALESMRMRLC